MTEWAGKISERAKSGMTIKDWCTANGIKPRVYYYWLKRVREYAAQFLPVAKSPGELPVPADSPTDNGRDTVLQELLPAPAVPSGWAICRSAPADAEPSQSITIEIGKGRITATSDTDPALLAKVFRVLVEL